MKRYTVSCDLLVPVLLEIRVDDDEDEDTALLKLHEMSKRDLLSLANTEEDAIGIVEGSETVELTPS